MAEAGVEIPFKVWKKWGKRGPIVQNLWLEARQEVEQVKLALTAQVFADSIGLAVLEGPPSGGTLAQDMVMARLPGVSQDAYERNRLLRKAHAEAMLAATEGIE